MIALKPSGLFQLTQGYEYTEGYKPSLFIDLNAYLQYF